MKNQLKFNKTNSSQKLVVTAANFSNFLARNNIITKREYYDFDLYNNVWKLAFRIIGLRFQYNPNNLTHYFVINPKTKLVHNSGSVNTKYKFVNDHDYIELFSDSNSYITRIL